MKENTESNVKKNRKHYSHKKLDAKWYELYKQAEDRQADYDKLTVAQKIEQAKSRRGESKREIARLTKLLKTQKTPAVKR